MEENGRDDGRHGYRNIKGKVRNTSLPIRPETMAMTEEHQEKLQVCENNWARRFAGVKRIDKRIIEELREDIGVKGILTRRLMRSRLKWAGHG